MVFYVSLSLATVPGNHVTPTYPFVVHTEGGNIFGSDNYYSCRKRNDILSSLLAHKDDTNTCTCFANSVNLVRFTCEFAR